LNRIFLHQDEKPQPATTWIASTSAQQHVSTIDRNSIPYAVYTTSRWRHACEGMTPHTTARTYHILRKLYTVHGTRLDILSFRITHFRQGHPFTFPFFPPAYTLTSRHLNPYDSRQSIAQNEDITYTSAIDNLRRRDCRRLYESHVPNNS
jgi:hypothetical protein